MDISEKHLKFSWKIEPKPEGGFIARSPDTVETVEGATQEEVLAKVRKQIAAAIGPEIAARLDFSHFGTHVQTHIEKKFSLSLKPAPSPGPSDQARFGSDAPPPIDAGSGSMLSALWKVLVLIGIGVVIWLLLTHR